MLLLKDDIIAMTWAIKLTFVKIGHLGKKKSVLSAGQFGKIYSCDNWSLGQVAWKTTINLCGKLSLLFFVNLAKHVELNNTLNLLCALAF